MNSDNKRYIIDIKSTIFEALETIDKNSKKCLIVLNNNKVVGTLTDGDIRRTLLKGLKIDHGIDKAMNKNFIYILDDEDEVSRNKKVKESFGKSSDNILPVVKKDKTFIDLIFDFHTTDNSKKFKALILAGGAGKRLNPITLDTPKPLVPIGGEPIIFRIIKQIVNSGISDVNISVHYKHQKIIDEVGDGSQFSANIHYIIENEPLGTLGSASNLEYDQKSVLLINSDILTNMSFNLFINEYVKSKADMLMGIKEFYLNIPYGVVEVNKNKINKFTEKPEFPYFISAGINILSNKIVKKIPNKKIDIPELLEIVGNNYNVKSYLISEYWSDIGNLNDLENANKLFDGKKRVF